MTDVPIIYNQFGRPMERPAPTKAELTREIAGPTLTGVRTHHTGYPGDGLNPYRLASILREADQGQPLRYLELAETIEERDLHYAGVLGTRKRSVAQIDISVNAASDAPEHVRHADMLRAWLLRDELQDELFDILDAIGKGYSFTEIVWDTSEGQWNPQRLEWRDPRWFNFSSADGTTPLLRTDDGDQPLMPMKFIHARVKAKSGLPVRSGIARIAAWAWMFKAFTQRDWAIFTQTFGQPIRVGRYQAGASETDKDTLFRAVANIAGDCAAIIPASMELEFVQTPNIGASSDLYQNRANWLDQQISKAVLGQTATTDAIAGGHAIGREHRQVQEDIERADSKALSAILNRDLVRPWIDLEFGPQKVYPRLLIARPEQKDVKLIVESVKELVPFGLRVQTSDISDMLGLADPDEGAELLVAPAAPKPDVATDPSRRGIAASEDEDGSEEEDEALQRALHARQRRRAARDVVDILAAQAEDVVAPATDRLIDRVRELVDSAGSLDEIREQLLELVPDMPEADFAHLMRQALVMAELAGRNEAGEA